MVGGKMLLVLGSFKRRISKTGRLNKKRGPKKGREQVRLYILAYLVNLP